MRDVLVVILGGGQGTRLFPLTHRRSKDLVLFIGASLAVGLAYSMFDSTFNNFLNEQFALTGFQRSFLEFPRELPGFLVVFVSALLWFFCSRRLSVIPCCCLPPALSS